jgi:hypothetical protein
MNRLIAADNIANTINEYLADAGWTVDGHTFFQRDPLTNCTHNLMAAFQVQFERDLQSTKQLKSSIFLIKSQVLLG